MHSHSPDPPSRPDCDVFAFGDDSEMARSQFSDHGGVYDAVEDADTDILSSPCSTSFSPPQDGHAGAAGADYFTAAAGTPTTLVPESPRQPLSTPLASRPATLTEQQAAMHARTDAPTPSALLFGAPPAEAADEPMDAADPTTIGFVFRYINVS